MSNAQLPMNMNPTAEADNTDFMATVAENHLLEVRHGAEFRRTFSRSLHDFFDLRTGFDLIAFDDKVIHSEDGVSVAEAIERDYGAKALILIKEVIRYNG